MLVKLECLVSDPWPTKAKVMFPHHLREGKIPRSRVAEKINKDTIPVQEHVVVRQTTQRRAVQRLASCSPSCSMSSVLSSIQRRLQQRQTSGPVAWPRSTILCSGPAFPAASPAAFSHLCSRQHLCDVLSLASSVQRPVQTPESYLISSVLSRVLPNVQPIKQ